MITLHHLENSRSQRILWLLEELGVEYRIQRYQRDKTSSLAAQMAMPHGFGNFVLVSRRTPSR